VLLLKLALSLEICGQYCKTFLSIKARLHWRNFFVKASATATDFKDYKLVLATFGDTTLIRLFLFHAALSKVAKASTLSVTVADVFKINFAKENTI
jgi:hypothetical protein